VLERSIADPLDLKDVRLLRAPRLDSNCVVFSGDVPVILSGQNGERLTPARDAGASRKLPDALRALRDHYVPANGSFASSVTVREWDGRPVLESEAAEMLETAGFRRDYPAMTFDAVQARALSMR
jgi:hypothetical protein